MPKVGESENDYAADCASTSLSLLSTASAPPTTVSGEKGTGNPTRSYAHAATDALLWTWLNSKETRSKIMMNNYWNMFAEMDDRDTGHCLFRGGCSFSIWLQIIMQE
ncbi:hypothetical protein E1B28_013735 [Marasmius oreades]|uniref:Uncharacterized protein n=1 Tax=Marasmius oreades TaxID=181124 RepID=A0A9P7RQD6_9AGAR|nr:uncharacterized protein E1B28_013735 [Marasmius oreades]KAG7087794.1 hypothetical protein E1B28_013735 [Marasmius oreades]